MVHTDSTRKMIQQHRHIPTRLKFHVLRGVNSGRPFGKNQEILAKPYYVQGPFHNTPQPIPRSRPMKAESLY